MTWAARAAASRHVPPSPIYACRPTSWRGSPRPEVTRPSRARSGHRNRRRGPIGSLWRMVSARVTAPRFCVCATSTCGSAANAAAPVMTSTRLRRSFRPLDGSLLVLDRLLSSPGSTERDAVPQTTDATVDPAPVPWARRSPLAPSSASASRGWSTRRRARRPARRARLCPTPRGLQGAAGWPAPSRTRSGCRPRSPRKGGPPPSVCPSPVHGVGRIGQIAGMAKLEPNSLITIAGGTLRP